MNQFQAVKDVLHKQHTDCYTVIQRLKCLLSDVQRLLSLHKPNKFNNLMSYTLVM